MEFTNNEVCTSVVDSTNNNNSEWHPNHSGTHTPYYQCAVVLTFPLTIRVSVHDQLRAIHKQSLLHSEAFVQLPTAAIIVLTPFPLTIKDTSYIKSTTIIIRSKFATLILMTYQLQRAVLWLTWLQSVSPLSCSGRCTGRFHCEWSARWLSSALSLLKCQRQWSRQGEHCLLTNCTEGAGHLGGEWGRVWRWRMGEA